MTDIDKRLDRIENKLDKLLDHQVPINSRIVALESQASTAKWLGSLLIAVMLACVGKVWKS